MKAGPPGLILWQHRCWVGSEHKSDICDSGGSLKMILNQKLREQIDRQKMNSARLLDPTSAVMD